MESELVHALRELRDDRRMPDDRISVLIKAAKVGRITSLICQMPTCACPGGRDHFERRATPRFGPWAPSADRWPIPGRDGGLYKADNVRLAHKFCNQAEGGRVGGHRGLGVRHVMSPEGLAALVKNGQRVGALARAPEERERSRRLGLLYGPINGPAAGRRLAANAATPEGLAQRRRALELGRQTHDQLVANSRKGACVQWAIGRGKPCNCGTHL